MNFNSAVVTFVCILREWTPESVPLSLDEILKKNRTSTSILGPSEPYVRDLQVMGGNSGADGSVRVGHLNLVSSVQGGQ